MDEGHAKHAAPGELERVRRFLNTRDIEEGLDEIAEPESLRDWLKANGFPARTGLGAADVERAAAMRESLRALTFANNGEPLEPHAVPKLNSLAAEARLQVRFDDHGHTVLEPAPEGADAALAELLAVVFRSMAEGSWTRLKACRDANCQWAFYDRSKNRSATWCSMEVCGNRAKARAYRKRRRKPT